MAGLNKMLFDDLLTQKRNPKPDQARCRRRIEAGALLIELPNVQECDATEDQENYNRQSPNKKKPPGGGLFSSYKSKRD